MRCKFIKNITAYHTFLKKINNVKFIRWVRDGAVGEGWSGAC